MNKKISLLKTQYKVAYLILLSFFLVFLSGCNGSQQKNKNGDTQTEAYDSTPYAHVPEPEDVVMYEVNLRAFSEKDALKAVIGRLDEIKSLGTNVIWLMPLYKQGEGPRNVKEDLGSPYCIKDYKAVNPEYGTIDDLKLLVTKAHEKGMAVILDWVANHTSWDNEWINNKGWYTTNANGEIIHPVPTDWTDVADLNYDNADMQAAMIDAMKFWFTEANIDGYRCDAADFISPISLFWTKAVSELREFNSERRILMLAEGHEQDYFAAGFDMDYGWNFYARTDSVYNKYDEYSFSKFFAGYTREVNAGKKQVHFTTNHDKSAWEKTDVQLFNGERGAMSAFVLTATLGGIPLIYSTQEIGREEIVPFFSCTSIDWNSNPAILNEYKAIMKAYTSSDIFARGTLETFPAIADVACFTKSKDNKKVMVAVNVKNKAVAFAVPQQYVGTSWKNMMDDNTTISLSSAIEMPAYQYYILEKQ